MNMLRRIYDKLFVNYSRISKDVSFKISSNFKKIDSDILMLKEKNSNIENEILKVKASLINSNYVNSELFLLKDKGKKKILSVGFYGAPNLGD